MTAGSSTTVNPGPCSSLMQRMRAELRRARLQFKKGQLSAADYEKVVNEYMQYAIREQERIGLDVLVHGEPERTDMCATLATPSGLLFDLRYSAAPACCTRACVAHLSLC